MNQLALTFDELNRLGECEAIIEKGLQTFVEVGNALLEIRDARLYRQEFDTFEDYCRLRWKISRPRAYELLNAARVVQNLSAVADTPIPTHERQVRPLTKLESGQQRQAWAAATVINPKPTAAQVEQIAKTIERAIVDAHRDFAAENPVFESDEQPLTEVQIVGPDWCENWLTINAAIRKILAMPDFDACKAAEFAVYQNGNSTNAQKAVLILQAYIEEIEKLCTQKIYDHSCGLSEEK